MKNLYNHQINLVERARESFLKGYKAPCIVSPCGSGKSLVISEIAKLTANKKNRVLFLIHRRELKEQITKTFKEQGVDMDFVDIYMVQTLIRRLDKIKEPNLIITDENHHSLASTYKKIYNYFNNALRLGFTATPIRLNGAGLGDVNDVLIIGKSVNWLIENNFLSPFRYFAPEVINTNTLRKSRGEYIVGDINYTSVIYSNVLKTYEKLAKGKKCICYCPNVEFSKKIADDFSKNGINAIHFDAKTDKKTRTEIVEDFRKNKIQVLCNVDLIGEGFDVPDCEVVLLLRPTMSLSLYIQQAMRSMRYVKNKIALIIDCVGNVERFGLPNMEREWKLNTKEKEKQQKNEIKTSVKTCPLCFYCIDSKEKTCPNCGFTFKGREIEVDESVEIKELDFNFTLNLKDWKECKNMKELRTWCVDNGYKAGRAYYLGKILKFI